MTLRKISPNQAYSRLKNNLKCTNPNCLLHRYQDVGADRARNKLQSVKAVQLNWLLVTGMESRLIRKAGVMTWEETTSLTRWMTSMECKATKIQMMMMNKRKDKTNKRMVCPKRTLLPSKNISR